MGPLSIQRYDRDSVRLLRGERVVGMILRCADDMWSINDTSERKVTKRRFVSPERALDYAGGLLFFREGAAPTPSSDR